MRLLQLPQQAPHDATNVVQMSVLRLRRLVRLVVLAGDVPSHAHKNAEKGSPCLSSKAAESFSEWRPRAPNIITNPPFKLSVPFARRAVGLTSGKVAMLLKIAFLEGIERGELFRLTPLARCWVFSQRLSFQPGGSTEARSLEGGGMMAFGWFVWDHQHSGPPTLGWI